MTDHHKTNKPMLKPFHVAIAVITLAKLNPNTRFILAAIDPERNTTEHLQYCYKRKKDCRNCNHIQTSSLSRINSRLF